VVSETEQRPCTNTAGEEECLGFAKAGKCDENKKWMYRNCEQTCKRCVDHMPFWHGGNVTHVRRCLCSRTSAACSPKASNRYR
jgi:uncharacterized protein (DUF427 family)